MPIQPTPWPRRELQNTSDNPTTCNPAHAIAAQRIAEHADNPKCQSNPRHGRAESCRARRTTPAKRVAEQVGQPRCQLQANNPRHGRAEVAVQVGQRRCQFAGEHPRHGRTESCTAPAADLKPTPWPQSGSDNPRCQLQANNPRHGCAETGRAGRTTPDANCRSTTHAMGAQRAESRSEPLLPNCWQTTYAMGLQSVAPGRTTPS